MKKNIVTVDELRNSTGEIVDSVCAKGERYVVSRDGKPVAAVVPIELLQADEEERERLFSVLDEVHAQNPGPEPEDMERLIEETIAEVRAGRRARRAQSAAKP